MNYQKHSEMKYFQKGMETDFPYAERKAWKSKGFIHRTYLAEVTG